MKGRGNPLTPTSLWSHHEPALSSNTRPILVFNLEVKQERPGPDMFVCDKRCEDASVGSEKGLEWPNCTPDLWPTPSG